MTDVLIDSLAESSASSRVTHHQEGPDDAALMILDTITTTTAASDDAIIVPRPMDIFCGRGRYMSHPGNTRFQSIIELHRPAYQQATRREEKAVIAGRVARELQFYTRPSDGNGSDTVATALIEPVRYLLKSQHHGIDRWHVVDDDYIKEKISHALRSRPKAAEKRRADDNDGNDEKRQSTGLSGLEAEVESILQEQRALLKKLISEQVFSDQESSTVANADGLTTGKTTMRWPPHILQLPRSMTKGSDAKKQKCEVCSALSPSCIKIDGSEGEGGGQILRNAITYAGILQKEIYIDKIRAGRTKPGLQAQHVTSLQLVASLCGGVLEGATRDSLQIHYRPPPHMTAGHDDEPARSATTSHRTVTGVTGTAGSICLLLQAALPCALLGQSLQSATTTTLILKGGTNADMAPQYDYWELVLLPILQSFVGIATDQIQPRMIRRGYYPKGGGEVHVRVKHCSASLKPIRMTDRGDVIEVYIRSFHAGKLGRLLAQQMASACHCYLKSQIVDSAIVWKEDVVTETSAIGNGLGILVLAKTSTGCILAGSSLCKPKQAAKNAGEAAGKELWEALCAGGCVDDWLQDQLIVYMALANGPSKLLTGSLTLHTRTAIMVAEQMTDAVFQVEKLSSAAATTTTTMGSTDEDRYGAADRVPGKHMIRCTGSSIVCNNA